MANKMSKKNVRKMKSSTKNKKKTLKPLPKVKDALIEVPRKKAPGEGWQKGNQLWMHRAKHGRDKLFASPELMWEEAVAYFKWVDAHPLMETKPQVVAIGNNMGSMVEMTQVPHKRPYTLMGLCIYLDCTSSYFRVFKSRLNKDDAESQGFVTVISRIEEVIYNQKFEGAASGFFNANIISRDLGLVDRVDQTSGDQPILAPIIQVMKGSSPPLTTDDKQLKE